jgi:hypothetical protein
LLCSGAECADPRDVLVAALTAGLALSTVAALELHRQDQWRTWDVAHHGVALVLPDLAGFEPIGMRFYSSGIEVQMTGSGGPVLVDLLDRDASLARVCDTGTCWDKPGNGWSSDSAVTRRHGDRLIQIRTDDGGHTAIDSRRQRVQLETTATVLSGAPRPLPRRRQTFRSDGLMTANVVPPRSK